LTATEEAALDALALKVSEKSGWYIDLTQSGEKSTSSALAIDGVAYFTSYTPPDLSGSGSVCVIPAGSGWLYAVDLAFGTKVYNWSADSDKNRGDRIAYISEQFLGSPTLIVTDDGDPDTDDDAVGNIIVGRKIMPVDFPIQTLRTYMYTTEPQ
jgi:type IV pilus assembly protein PilY1